MNQSHLINKLSKITAYVAQKASSHNYLTTNL